MSANKPMPQEITPTPGRKEEDDKKVVQPENRNPIQPGEQKSEGVKQDTPK